MSFKKCQKLSTLSLKYLKFLSSVHSTSDNTYKSYATDLGQFLAPLGVKKIYWVTSDPVKSPEIEWKSEPGQPEHPLLLNWNEDELLRLARQAMKSWSDLATSSRNRKTACLKSFFKWLFQEEHIDRDLASSLICPKPQAKLPHFLSVDEALALVQALSHSSSTTSEQTLKRDRALILLLYGGGLRVSEACQLKWKEIDESQSTLRIRGKGDKERLVVLPPFCLKAVLALKTNHSAYVFGDKPLNTRTAYQIVRDWGCRAGLLKPLHPHALRHSFATHMLSSGSDLRTLQEMLGHESLAATQKYTHLSLDALARTLQSHHPLAQSEDD